MTDFADACFHCGGHRRRNVWTKHLCPECWQKYERGEITELGDPVEPLTAVHSDPLLGRAA